MTVALKVLRWKLKEVMARYDIQGVDLAKEMDVRTATISNLRNSKTIPSIGGEKLDRLTASLSKLANTAICLGDLYEEVDNN